ncbi:hypothetical protein SAMN04487948_109106 [Halogranum amylolyticum]|uniref:Uncharacterized protein n=1 Tax=Halogranum amylolyticum TaxID=660520 RepID=A0A1H8U4Q4_9EURY|nr:hypothetical protein [Halogranum amylolyticum]SEO97628.1 hypothetical protein SAMN04487948_109106 [Halogranum amylolyticum]
MSSALTVDLNRDRLHDVAAPKTYTTDEAFYVALENHGEAVHIHLHLDDTLSTVAQLAGGNHYVDAGSTETVRVDVDPDDEPVTGKLKIVTGYGAETTYVDVTIEPFEEKNHGVDVDEELGKPQRRDPAEREPSLSEQFAGMSSTSSDGGVPVVAIGGLLLLLALVVGLLVDNAVILLGVGVVIGGVLVALALQTRS